MSPKEWGKCVLVTKHRKMLMPILVYCEETLTAGYAGHPKNAGTQMPRTQIAQAVATARDICSPYHAAEAPRQPSKTPPRRRSRQ